MVGGDRSAELFYDPPNFEFWGDALPFGTKSWVSLQQHSTVYLVVISQT